METVDLYLFKKLFHVRKKVFLDCLDVTVEMQFKFWVNCTNNRYTVRKRWHTLSVPFFSSFFQHYKLYEFVFSHTQAEEIIGADVSAYVDLKGFFTILKRHIPIISK